LVLAAGSAPTLLRYPLLALAGLQVVRQAYWLVRSIVEVSWLVRVTGTLLDISQAGRSNTDSYGERLGITQDLPTFYYFVVDDGSSDVLRPWIVNRSQARGTKDIRASAFGPDGAGAFLAEISSVAFRPGDRVHLEGERWTRYARSVQRRTRPSTLVDVAVANNHADRDQLISIVHAIANQGTRRPASTPTTVAEQHNRRLVQPRDCGKFHTVIAIH
jgi:hypothetical protein